MKTSILTTLFATSTVLASVLALAAPVKAFSWNNSWTQPTIRSKTEIGFDDAPFQKFVQAERIQLPGAGQFLLDPSKLFLKYEHEVKVHFINEGAGYRNQLAFEATGATNASGLVFSDISSTEAIGNWGGDALKLGDTVSLGKMAAGTQLDFWLRADGYNGGTNIFGTKTASNLDRLQHVVAYAYRNYLILGFEDLYGDLWAQGIDPLTGIANENSDRDFNDVVVVVDIGEANLRELTGVPEPTMVMALAATGLMGALGLRRRLRVPEA
jgi:hypothetical protein